MDDEPSDNVSSLHDKLIQKYTDKLAKDLEDTPPISSSSRQARRHHEYNRSSGRKRSRDLVEEHPPKTKELTPSTTPIEIQRCPLYVFAKMVAGVNGDNLNLFINYANLAKEEPDVDPDTQELIPVVGMMSLEPVLIAGTQAGKAAIEQVRKLLIGARPIDWLKDIVMNPRHELYQPFFMLVAAWCRFFIGKRTRSTDSRVARQDFKYDLKVEQGNFSAALAVYLMGLGASPRKP